MKKYILLFSVLGALSIVSLSGCSSDTSSDASGGSATLETYVEESADASEEDTSADTEEETTGGNTSENILENAESASIESAEEFEEYTEEIGAEITDLTDSVEGAVSSYYVVLDENYGLIYNEMEDEDVAEEKFNEDIADLKDKADSDGTTTEKDGKTYFSISVASYYYTYILDGNIYIQSTCLDDYEDSLSDVLELIGY